MNYENMIFLYFLYLKSLVSRQYPTNETSPVLRSAVTRIESSIFGIRNKKLPVEENAWRRSITVPGAASATLDLNNTSSTVLRLRTERSCGGEGDASEAVEDEADEAFEDERKLRAATVTICSIGGEHTGEDEGEHGTVGGQIGDAPGERR